MSDETEVIVRKGPNRRSYHRPVNEECRPACQARGYESEANWMFWTEGQGAVWLEPCQYPRCYGESNVGSLGATGLDD